MRRSALMAAVVCAAGVAHASGPPPARPTVAADAAPPPQERFFSDGTYHLSADELAALPNLFPTRIEEPNDPAYLPMARRLAKLRNPELSGDLVSKLLRLSIAPVQMIVKECGGPDAYYDPNSHQIVFCFEELRYVNQMAGKKGADLYLLDRQALITNVFIAFHEIGHALVDLLKLPVHASSEDMADEFAFLMLTSVQDSALVKELIKAPEMFLFHHGEDMKGQADPTGKHRSGQQRAFIALCTLHGRAPDADTTRALGVQAERCREDTARKVEAWNRALAPHTRIHSGRVF